MVVDADTIKLGVSLIELAKAAWPVSLAIGGTATVAAVFGVLPRVGPLRALSLAYKSRLFFTPEPPSVRTMDKAKLISLLQAAKNRKTYEYVVVEGPKAVGKTTLINDVLTRTHGLVEVDVKPASSSTTIENDVYREVAGLSTLSFNLKSSAMRVVKWHQRFGTVLCFSDARPTVLLRVQERNPGQDFAAVTPAARTLTQLGLRVVIDASTNALSPTAVSTTRESVLSVDPMTREEVENIESIKAIFDKLRERELDQVVWNIIGGVPTVLTKLDVVLADGVDVDEVVGKFLRAQLLVAQGKIVHDVKMWKSVFAEFKTKKECALATLPEDLTDKGMPKCLRFKLYDAVLIPASASYAFLLQHDLWREPQGFPLAQLKTLCGSTPPTSTILSASTPSPSSLSPSSSAATSASDTVISSSSSPSSS